VLFLTLTLLPAAALVWAGWLLIEKDKDQEYQSLQKHQNEVADLIEAALHQGIVTTGQRLVDSGAWKDIAVDGAFIVAINSQGFQTIPPTKLLYYPVQPQLTEATDEMPNSNEKIPLLPRSQDRAIRAAADVRLAMTLRLTGQLAAALDVYADLAKLEDVQVVGNPADLVARYARCTILASLSRHTQLRHEAEALLADLRAGRWQLDRGNYGAFTYDIPSWLGRDPPPDAEKEKIAQEVYSVWERWQDSRESLNFSGSKSNRSGNQSMTLVWTGTSDRLTVLVAGPQYIQNAWLSGVTPLLKDSGMSLVLQDESGRAVFDNPINGPATERPSTMTHLPWTLQVGRVSPIESRFSTVYRNNLYIAGLALLLAVIAAGAYFVGRSVTRELAVARLQADFVAAVSHEFRTPLTLLRQVTELLNDDRKTDPSRLKSYYQAQIRATERLQRLIESLLDFGKMEAGAKSYRMQRLEVSNWARSVIEEFRAGGPGSCQIQFQTHCDNGSLAAVHADPDALAHALRNLIDNAIKYSPDCRQVWVDLRRSGNRLAISVRDQGLGIPPNERKQIFHKFVRGAAAKTNGIKGTGIGLAMVQQIVEAHGGDIQLESQPGQGSTFTILLPESRS